MNEILRHYVPQNDIGQEPVIASEAISSFLAGRLPRCPTELLAMT